MKIVINKLFDKYDFNIDFDKKCTVLIGENGTGKSTVINILNCLFKRNFIELSKYRFERIEIDSKIINYEDLIPSYENFKLNLIFQIALKRSRITIFGSKEKNIDIFKEVDFKIDEKHMRLNEKKKYRVSHEFSTLTNIDIKEYTKKELNKIFNIFEFNDNVFRKIYVEYFKERNNIEFFYNESLDDIQYTVDSINQKFFGKKYRLIKGETICFTNEELINLIKNSIKSLDLQREKKNGYSYYYTSKFDDNSVEKKKFVSNQYLINAYNSYKLENNDPFNEKMNVDENSYIKMKRDGVLVKSKYDPFKDMKNNNKVNIAKICFYYYFNPDNIRTIISNINNKVTKVYMREMESNSIEYNNKISKEVSRFYEEFFWDKIRLNNIYDITHDVDNEDKALILHEVLCNNSKWNDEDLLYINDKLKLINKLLNKYIKNKRVLLTPKKLLIYDENKKIAFDYLSQGEKKIILIILLSFYEDDLILFLDEPETSLSIIWQEELLSDLIKYSKLKNLIVATQSPYIIKEESLLDNVLYLPMED